MSHLSHISCTGYSFQAQFKVLLLLFTGIENAGCMLALSKTILSPISQQTNSTQTHTFHSPEIIHINLHSFPHLSNPYRSPTSRSATAYHYGVATAGASLLEGRAAVKAEQGDDESFH